MAHIPLRDWEILSAYLDSELTERERKLLEDRLRADENLRLSLHTMGQVRAALRSQPDRRAPRNFTISPEMARVISQRKDAENVFPVMRLASALATIFFVVIFVGNFFASQILPTQISQSNPVQQPAVGMGGGGGGGGFKSEESFSVPEDLSEREVAPEINDMAAEALPVEPIPVETEAQLKAILPGALPTASPVSEAMREAPQAGQLVEQAPSETSAEQDTVPPVSIVLILQVVLAFLAVITGAIAFFIRRSIR